MTPSADVALQHFRTELRKTYGRRLERLVVFGSRARGDARSNSDYDVAVFLRKFESFGAEPHRRHRGDYPL